MKILIQIFKYIVNSILSFIGLEMRRKENISFNKKRRLDEILDFEDKILNFDGELILVYQMGKVASSTVYMSLIKRGFNTFHFHHLTDITSSQLEYIIQDGYAPNNYVEEIYRGNLRSKFFLNRLFLNNKEHLSKIKIISITREPISYLISAFFQNYPTFYSNYYDKSSLNDIYNVKNLKSLENYFLNYINKYIEIYYGNNSINDNNYDKLWKNIKNPDLRHFFLLCRWPIIWFNREMENIFNFDIFSFGFDKKLGYKTYNINGISILVIKLERFKDISKRQIAKFINDENFEIINDNLGIEKKYKDLYNEFLSSIVLPKEFIELQYSSKYAKYFYTKEELDDFANKWI